MSRTCTRKVSAVGVRVHSGFAVGGLRFAGVQAGVQVGSVRSRTQCVRSVSVQ